MSKRDIIDDNEVIPKWEVITDFNGATKYWMQYIRVNSELNFGNDFIELRNQSLILGNNGWVISEQAWLRFLTWYRGVGSTDKSFMLPEYQLKHFYRSTIQLNGKVLNCLSDFPDVYGHVLLESIYKIFAYYEAYKNFDALDSILISKLGVSILIKINNNIYELAKDKIITSSPKAKYICNDVVALPHPSCCMNVSNNQVRVINKYLSIDNKQSTQIKRLFFKNCPRHYKPE